MIIPIASCKTITRIRNEGIPAPQIALKTEIWSWRDLTPEEFCKKLPICSICISFCVCSVMIVFSGCAGSTLRVDSAYQVDRHVDPVQVKRQLYDDLIYQLNVSPSKNLEARSKLVAIGEPALVALMPALELDRKKLSKDVHEKSMRILRVLRLMRSSAGIEYCGSILLGGKIEEPSPEQWALLTEAVAYISENLSDPRARDIYVSFLYNNKDRYMGKRYLKRHWHGGKNKDVFRVDVTYGVPFLVEMDDSRVKGVLTHLLRIVTHSSYGGSFVWRLGEDGYSTALDEEK